jgi:hypothetical protein
MPRPADKAFALATLLALAGGSLAGPGPMPVRAQGELLSQAAGAGPAQGQPALSVEQARAAANEILKAEQNRDAKARFSQFAPELQQVSSPGMVADTMAKRPRVLSWKLLSVQSGIQTTTVEASVVTTAGNQDLFIMLNPEGKLSGYYIDKTDQAPSKVAAQFVSARSFFSPAMQKEVSAASLQARWQRLQQYTGNFMQVKRLVEAAENPEQRLVLVQTEFNRLTDNLFVILDANNLITGVDFPIDPNPLRGSR